MNDRGLLYVALAGVMVLVGAKVLQIAASIGEFLINMAVGGLSLAVHLAIGAVAVYLFLKFLGRFK